jgi:carboxypeptidase D
LENYSKDAEIRALLTNYELHILPSLNPDGFFRARRANARGYDLNRNFPDRFYGQITPLQPETRAMMDWHYNINFTKSIVFHGGALVANIPYDGNAQRRSGAYTPTKDNAVFRRLALAYASHNRRMHASRQFKDGITNGAMWYVIYGSSQDWVYEKTGCKELTVEVSNQKNPSATTLNGFFNANYQSILAFIKTSAH